MWILKIRECHRVPLSVMDSVIHDVESLFEVTLSFLSTQVETSLERAGVSQDVVESVTAALSDHPPVFDGLHTQQQQMTYFKRNFNFVVSITVFFIVHLRRLRYRFSNLQTRVKIAKMKAKGFGAKRRIVEEEETFTYVPILESLQALLNNETVLSEVRESSCVCSCTFSMIRMYMYIEHVYNYTFLLG